MRVFKNTEISLDLATGLAAALIILVHLLNPLTSLHEQVERHIASQTPGNGIMSSVLHHLIAAWS